MGVNRQLWRYENARFDPNNTVTTTFFIDLSLRYSVLTCMTARIIYDFQDNDSNQSVSDFYDNRSGAG